MSTTNFEKTPILQFGTSRFLQAHADLFVSEALERGAAIGPITVVQTSGDPGRRRRLDALAHPQGFPVRIQGVQDGREVRSDIQVTSVRKALDLIGDLAEVERLFVEEVEIVISNTGDAGWTEQATDHCGSLTADMSYPAKLTHLLHKRFQSCGEAIQIMPTELVARNGDVLKARVLSIGALFGQQFVEWLDREVLFVNSLVDRIVSEPIEPAGAVAEPYAMWAIEDQPGLLLPCRHQAVVVHQSLAPVERLKLHVLNLGHTYLVARSKEALYTAGHEFVRQMVADAAFRDDLIDLYDKEVLPVFASWGMDAQAREYVTTTIDRFANPFLDHRLADIAQNHPDKVERRIGAFVDAAAALPEPVSQPRLSAVVASVRTPEGAIEWS